MDGLAMQVTGPAIRVESPLRRESRALIAEADASLRKIYADDALLPLSAEDLAAPNVQFFVARQGGRALGCAALVDEFRFGVVRRLYVRPEARGLGVARPLMQELEQAASDIGLTVLRVETGPALEAAVSLYQSLGYVPCPAFGPYPEDPDNLFLEKRLI